MTDRDPPRRSPFGRHDYELTYGWRDEALNVTIGGKLATPPVIGDVYTLGSPDGIQDFTVVHLSREGGRGWLARCTATPYDGHGGER
ncbi:hypothetical protein SGCZBJ_04865 [Caulobacter zeae]|uniref:Uncharacterized protein n=1 Tax=Caulobacter zeae TaxID=2055137 RepID=A0A2N5DNT0_9CAUL|nr:hypothetical protein [Caulobacter zeae]PLR27697.1 hypothetical protein SGCZBJ_04865 [Caulobacter zeae]